MLCPVCKCRWSPYRNDHVVIKDDPFSIKFLKPEYQVEWQMLYDNDLRVACISCSIS
jgi:hypothetical protein